MTDPDRVELLLKEARLFAGVAGGKPDSKWLWASKTADKQRCYFQRLVKLDNMPDEAWLYMRGDNATRAFINGQRVSLIAASGAPAWSFMHANVTGLLRTDVNAISVDVTNSGGPAGLIAVFEMRYGLELRRVVSDSTWRVTEQKPKGWPGTTPAQWIWAKDMRDGQRCYFQRVVDLPAKPTAARLYGRGDDSLAPRPSPSSPRSI